MYPIMLNLKGKKVVIIGGGNIALRKTKGILAAGGKVKVVASNILAEFEKLDVELLVAQYDVSQLCGAQLIFACTDSKVTNKQIVADAAENQWVNDCSCQENSDFFNMATIISENYLVGLSSYGKHPANIKKLKEEIRTVLSEKNDETFKQTNME